MRRFKIGNDEGILIGPYKTYKSADRIYKEALHEFEHGYEGTRIIIELVFIGGKKGWAVVIYKPKKISWDNFDRFVGLIP